MHLSDRSGPVRPNGGLGALQAVWTDGFDEMRPLLRTIRDRDAQRRIEILVLRYLGGRAELFDRFARQGLEVVIQEDGVMRPATGTDLGITTA